MAWSWSFVPKRILREPRFLRLDDEAAGLLLRLYAAADRWGRGPMDADAFAVVAGALRGIPDFEARVNRLVDAGLVLVSEDGTSWQLDRYDEDAPRDVLRGRPASEYAEGRPGQYLSLPEKSAARRAVPQDAGNIRAVPQDAASGGTVRSCAREGRQAGRQVAPSLRSELPEAAPPRAPASEPSPPGSTDARASSAPPAPSAPSNATPPPSAPSPALGGAGRAQEREPSPEPAPPVVSITRPRPVRGSMLSEAERREREEQAATDAALEQIRRRNDERLGPAPEPMAEPPREPDEFAEPDWEALMPILAARSSLPEEV